MEIKGEIYKIGEVQTFNSFNKREFVVFVPNETNLDWSDYLKMEVRQDKCSLLDNINVGDDVNISVNLRGRLWTNKEGVEACFNTIQAWKIEVLRSQPQQSSASPQPPSDDDEPLPF